MLLGRVAPAVLAANPLGNLADLAGELASAGFIHETGELTSQAGALPGNAGADQKTEEAQGQQKQNVNDSDRPGAAAQ